MGSRKRKPLSDITDTFNLTPLSSLRDLVASNGICKPPVSIFKSNSNSTTHKFFPESSDRSNTSIGSSSVGATFNCEAVRLRQPPPVVTPTTSPGDIGTKEAHTRRHNNKNSSKERDADVIVSHTPSVKKVKGKAIALPLSSSASERRPDTQIKISNMALTDSSMEYHNAAYDPRQIIEISRKERKSDASVLEREGKGKAITVPYNSLPIGKLKGTQNSVCSSSTLGEISCQKGQGKLGYSDCSAVNVKETNQDKLVCYSHSSGKTDKMKANLSSSECTLGIKPEIKKNISDTSCFSLEKINYKKEGILNRTRSSIMQIEEKGEEYLSPSKSLVGEAKDRYKSVNVTNLLPDKTNGKGKAILETSEIRGPSATMAVNSRPSRKKSDKYKNDVSISSCPPMTRTKKIQNDLDEARDVKYLNSWTVLQEKIRKKRCWESEKTSGLPKEFIRDQKAYFDEVDNFELEVEEVSEDELD